MHNYFTEKYLILIWEITVLKNFTFCFFEKLSLSWEIILPAMVSSPGAAAEAGFLRVLVWEGGGIIMLAPSLLLTLSRDDWGYPEDIGADHDVDIILSWDTDLKQRLLIGCSRWNTGFWLVRVSRCLTVIGWSTDLCPEDLILLDLGDVLELVLLEWDLWSGSAWCLSTSSIHSRTLSFTPAPPPPAAPWS